MEAVVAPAQNVQSAQARELVNLVLVEALGSSATPFVPLPFVDDYLFARILRRTARKVLERNALAVDDRVTKALVEGYLREGDPSLGSKALTTAARFIVRKAAVVLDVKRSHDVFGETIAFALALDRAAALGAVAHANVALVGAVMYRAVQSIGSAALEVITRAGRDAWNSSPAGGNEAMGARFGRVGDAVSRQVEEAHEHLARLMREELARQNVLPGAHMR